MRIGIDARFYGVVRQGLGRYCEQLVYQVTRLDTHNHYVIFVSKGQRFIDLPDSVEVVETDIAWYGLAEQTRWPLLLYRYHLDVMHFTSFNVPLLYRKPYIVTIHDLILMHFPSAHASTLHPLLFWLKRAMYRYTIRTAVKRTSQIITVSSFTADDIRRTLRTTKPVEVVYLGADALAGHEDTRTTIHLPPDPYLLYVGNAYPHKNLEFMLSVFMRWSMDHPSYSLALAGIDDYFYRRLRSSFGSNAMLYWYNTATDADIAALYRHANAFVFPSLYEGFGIPPLEALRGDVPVVASRASCIPEVLRSAAEYFDPNDADSLIAALDRITMDMHRRDEILSAGRERVAYFTWQRMGERMVELYAKLENQYTYTNDRIQNAKKKQSKSR